MVRFKERLCRRVGCVCVVLQQSYTMLMATATSVAASRGGGAQQTNLPAIVREQLHAVQAKASQRKSRKRKIDR